MVTQVILKQASISIYSSFLMTFDNVLQAMSIYKKLDNTAAQSSQAADEAKEQPLPLRFASLPGALTISTLRIIQSSHQLCLGLSCPLYTSAKCNCVLRSCAFILSFQNETESQRPPYTFLSQVALLFSRFVQFVIRTWEILPAFFRRAGFSKTL